MGIKVIHVLGTVIIGGAELSVYNVLNSWCNKKFYQEILYTREISGKRVAFNDIGIKTTPLNWKSERDFYKILELSSYFRSAKPHIVHTHLITGNYWVVIAARLAKVPIVIETIHDESHFSKKGIILHRFFRRLLSSLFDKTICVSFGVKKYLETYLKCSNRDYQIIYNGLQDFTVNPELDLNKYKQSLNVADNKRIFLTIANLRPFKKGYEVYIEALSLLETETVKQIKVLIAGDKDSDHPEFFNDLKKKIYDLSLVDFFEFLGNRTDINELVSVSDIFVMPSMYEGGPLVVLEAMRGSKLVIATRTGAVPEYVIDGETGLIVEPGDSEALAAAIERILDNPASWVEMGEKGKKRFLEHFTVDKTVGKLTNLYLDLLEKKGIKHTDSNALHLD